MFKKLKRITNTESVTGGKGKQFFYSMPDRLVVLATIG